MSSITATNISQRSLKYLSNNFQLSFKYWLQTRCDCQRAYAATTAQLKLPSLFTHDSAHEHPVKASLFLSFALDLWVLALSPLKMGSNSPVLHHFQRACDELVSTHTAGSQSLCTSHKVFAFEAPNFSR